MTMVMEHLPVHPRKSSAARRRRNVNRLAAEIHDIVPGATTVLLTPVWTDARGPVERVYVVTARDATGRHLRLPSGGSRTVASLVQGAFPTARWDRPLTWHADTNTVSTWSPPVDDTQARLDKLRAREAALTAELAFEKERNHELKIRKDFADTEASGYIDRTGLES